MEFDLATEEGQLMFALQESAREATVNSQNRLFDESPALSRSSLLREDKHKPDEPSDGKICQFNTLNQFGDQFNNIKEELSTASAICGWLTMANITLTQKFLIERESKSLTLTEIRDFVRDSLCDFSVVLPELRASIEFTQNRRKEYWATHGKKQIERSDLMQWVANYELAALLHANNQHDWLSTKAMPTVFVRYNQWPERGDATSDELEQLRSEERFGGIMDPSNGSITYKEGDSVYFVEEYRSSSNEESDDDITKASKSVISSNTLVSRFSPEEWEEAFSAQSSGDSPDLMLPRVLAINLNGHFVAALACVLDGEKHLLVINTTTTDYLKMDPMIVWAFDCAFPNIRNES